MELTWAILLSPSCIHLEQLKILCNSFCASILLPSLPNIFKYIHCIFFPLSNLDCILVLFRGQVLFLRIHLQIKKLRYADSFSKWHWCGFMANVHMPVRGWKTPPWIALTIIIHGWLCKQPIKCGFNSAPQKITCSQLGPCTGWTMVWNALIRDVEEHLLCKNFKKFHSIWASNQVKKINLLLLMFFFTLLYLHDDNSLVSLRPSPNKPKMTGKKNHSFFSHMYPCSIYLHTF